MPGKFDFNKIENQKKFEDLSEKEQEKIVGEAQQEAIKIQEKIEGRKAKDYVEAKKLVEGKKTEKKEIILTPEQEKAKEEMIESLSNGYINSAIEIKDEFNLPKEIVQSSEVRSAAKKGMIKKLSYGYIDDAIKIKDKFNLPEEVIQSAAKERMIKRLSNGYINDVIGIKDKFNLPEEIIQSPEVQFAAKEGIIENLSNNYINYIDGAIKIKDKFNLPEEIIQSPEVQFAAKERIIERLSNGHIDDAIKIKDKFNLPEEVIQSVVKEEMIKRLSNGYINNAIKIKDEFNLSEEIVQSVAKEGMIKALSKGYINNAIEIKDKFNIVVTSQEIIDQIPELQNLLIKIQTISPEFYDQALKSVEIAISLVEFKDKPEEFLREIKENPFLSNAISENPRFGVRLLIKYPEFDKLSKENIQTLFEIKKEILTSNPEIKPESWEFRQLMQEKLKEYKNNSELLEIIEKSGINVEEWLNYSEIRYFNLESSESHLAFSETVSAPIQRIKETIDSYAHTVKEVLKQYRSELSEFKIPLEDVREIEVKIAQMRNELEKAKAEGNEKKAQGIEKGIESLKKKIENVKTVGLWDKLVGDISAFQRLKDDVFKAQGNLIKAENDLKERLSSETLLRKMLSGKMIQNIKEEISKAKEELRTKFSILETRIENFKTNLLKLITPCLTKERSESLIQEIEQNLAEQFDHYNTDCNTLTNLFSKRGDEKKSKLESQPMSIFVWARNPDIDLYQGNYTNCCIRIDSEHMGAESTIADYNTDLGIQIVNIWDEVKNEPAAAAWCWLGKSKNNEAVLVVDNIESNTLYSVNYPEQLTKELFDYLKGYAESVGAKKIVLGKANNDLPTASELAKMKEDKYKYEKIGGSNRMDGYFLEAENKSVKIVWEAKSSDAKAVAGKEKERQIKKIKFQNLDIKNLTENDFEKLKQLERKIYQGTDLILGQAMIEDIKQGNGFEYSIIVDGQKSAKASKEAVGYLAALEDETDEGDPCVYLEDIAVIPEAQGQEIGWKMLQDLIGKLKEKARKENKPVLLDMHLREESQRFMEKYGEQLERMGVKLLEEALVPDYYNEREDALYKVYQIKAD